MILIEYLNLITSEFREKPNFVAMMTADVSPALRIQELLSSFTTLFDVDAAAGDQLDIIGQWVGISRNVTIPIAGVYFSWDGDYTLGWDYGSWQNSLAPTDITVLPDDAYRTLIKAKIAANKWDGTTDGAYVIWDALFSTVTILIQDHQDMSYDLVFVGGIVDSLTLALIQGGYIQLKPEGVRVNQYVVPIDDGPLFAWDVSPTAYLDGWDAGSWGREIEPT